jgi:hypothetical protein
MDAFHSKLPNHFDLPRRIKRLGELTQPVLDLATRCAAPLQPD